MKNGRQRWPLGIILLAALSGVPGLSIAQTPPDSVITVKQIILLGNETTKDDVILREMALKPGTVFDTAALADDQNKIYSLELFNRVECTYSLEDRQATIVVTVSERWYIFPVPIFGFKYRDIKKPYYGAALVHQNFRGRNEKILASAVFGYDGWLSLAYQTPKLTEEGDIFFRGALSTSKVRNLNVADAEYDQRIVSGSVSVGKRYGLFTLASLTAGYDQWSISDPSPGRTVSASGTDRFITLAAGFLFDRRDIKEYPTEGVYAAFSVAKFGFGESDVNLTRFRVDMRNYALLGEGISLGARVMGTLLGGGVSPSYLHAYFGYDERIRGYFSEVLEGDNLVTANVELRLPILKPRYHTISLKNLPPEFSVWRYGLYAGIFADTGTIWYRGSPFTNLQWYTGYGAGLHFLLPYSLVIRTEYGFNQQGRGQFVLDFGASF